MCAQIVAPYPPPGRISVASQSGNLVSAFLNYAVLTGVGVSKAISCGNSAQTTLADYLDYFAADPETARRARVPRGRRRRPRASSRRVRRLTAREAARRAEGRRRGARASAPPPATPARSPPTTASSTASAASSASLRAPTVEQAFEWAATFATQPLPRGRRVVVFTTAGGWGVLTADACAAAGPRR